MEKMNQEEGGVGTTKMKLVKRDPDPMETETNGHQEEGKNIFLKGQFTKKKFFQEVVTTFTRAKCSINCKNAYIYYVYTVVA